MTDERLRRLSREAGGDDDARARWITERLRAGRLFRRRVELAAWLGDAAARLALGNDAPTPAPLPHARASRGVTARRDVQAWADDLVRYGKSAVVRATVALVDGSGYDDLDRPVLAPAREALATARAWLAAVEAAAALEGTDEEPELEAEQEACLLAEHRAVEAAAAEEGPLAELLMLASFAASAAASGGPAGARDALVAAFARAVLLGGPAVDVHVRDALVTWTLAPT